MRSRSSRIVLVGLLVSVLAAGWVLATPSTAIPAGVSVSTGDSMGYDSPRLLFYVDKEPEAGDVVLFRSYGEWVGHRAVEYVNREYEKAGVLDVRGWRTKGDALERPDQLKDGEHMAMRQALASESNTAGVVVAWVRLGFVFEVVASAVAAVGTLNVFEATPIFSRAPQGGR